MARFYIFKEFGQFILHEKKWWMVPLVMIFLVLGLVIVFAETSPLAPFLYPLF